MPLMDLSRDDLARAVCEGILAQEQADALWAALEVRAPSAPTTRARFDVVHFAWYFGALIVMGAMGWFMTVGWERLGGGGIFLVALAYAAAFVGAGKTLWNRKGLRIPGGLLVTMAVAMTPLATYGLERAFGMWPGADPGNYAGFHEWIKGGWFAMEVATVVAALVALRWFKFPFLTAPIAFALYMSMDLAPLLHRSWNERCVIALVVGALTVSVAVAIDRRTREDFAFWLYLFGTMTLWGGLTAMEGGTALGKFIYLRRRVFMVFGALGTMVYLTFLAQEVFKDSLLFPVVLSLVGIAVIALGVHLHRHAARYEAAFRKVIPEPIRAFLPPARS
jgi:hypothetical protein